MQELHDRRDGVLEIFLQIGLTEGHVLEHPTLFFHFADEAIQGKQVLINGLDFSLKPLIGLNEHGIALNGRLQFLELILNEANQGHRTLSDLLIAVENQITDRGKGLDILIAQDDLAVNFLGSKKRALTACLPLTGVALNGTERNTESTRQSDQQQKVSTNGHDTR